MAMRDRKVWAEWTNELVAAEIGSAGGFQFYWAHVFHAIEDMQAPLKYWRRGHWSAWTVLRCHQQKSQATCRCRLHMGQSKLLLSTALGVDVLQIDLHMPQA